MLTLLVSGVEAVFVIIGKRGASETDVGKQVWTLLVETIFIMSALLAHYFSRLFVQHCLFRYREVGLEFRCFCLWAWYESISCFCGLALGPFSTFLDYLKGLLSTMVAGLILQKPNFVQFGELSDYVYCTYCASLYLERVAEDQHRLRTQNHAAESALGEALALDNFDLDYQNHEDHALQLEELSYRYMCPLRCMGCLVAFGGTPILVGIILNFIGASMGYHCETEVWFLPLDLCPGNISGEHAH